MKFTATKCNFNNVSGYMFKQWCNEVCICSQFVPEEYFLDFCKDAGIDEKQVIFD